MNNKAKAKRIFKFRVLILLIKIGLCIYAIDLSYYHRFFRYDNFILPEELILYISISIFILNLKKEKELLVVLVIVSILAVMTKFFTYGDPISKFVYNYVKDYRNSYSLIIIFISLVLVENFSLKRLEIYQYPKERKDDLKSKLLDDMIIDEKTIKKRGENNKN